MRYRDRTLGEVVISGMMGEVVTIGTSVVVKEDAAEAVLGLLPTRPGAAA